MEIDHLAKVPSGLNATLAFEQSAPGSPLGLPFTVDAYHCQFVSIRPPIAAQELTCVALTAAFSAAASAAADAAAREAAAADAWATSCPDKFASHCWICWSAMARAFGWLAPTYLDSKTSSCGSPPLSPVAR